MSVRTVSELRYLAVNIVKFTSLKFSFDRAKQIFYRAANSIFGKIGRFASEEVVIQLFKSKCLPTLLYCTEACKMLKSNLKSFDFAVNRFFMKLLKTSNTDIVNYSQDQFGFKLPSEIIPNCTAKFIAKLQASDCV